MYGGLFQGQTGIHLRRQVQSLQGVYEINLVSSPSRATPRRIEIAPKKRVPPAGAVRIACRRRHYKRPVKAHARNFARVPRRPVRERGGPVVTEELLEGSASPRSPNFLGPVNNFNWRRKFGYQINPARDTRGGAPGKFRYLRRSPP